MAAMNSASEHPINSPQELPGDPGTSMCASGCSDTPNALALRSISCTTGG
eukprot:CAMPEP_0184252350 /NCGR_PEP_ID=MMETSP0977-20130417/5940_1 /TAXON_ID=483370 /ORGANISM="non described non described, Strain CCMP2097" /LENGTH=49 /DNA_ID= /DNA_START= /DNA_END= /DNA_ORIENTATION=